MTMYGSEKLNSHYVLCYGLTKEFLDQYKKIQYKDVEVPSTLISYFHGYIQSWVTHNRVKRNIVQKMRAKHRMETIEHAQKALCRNPRMIGNLSAVSHRKTILISVKLIDFALDQLRKHHVILILADQRDEIFLRGRKLPPRFQLFRMHLAIQRVTLPRKARSYLNTCIQSTSNTNAFHPFFGSASFNSWLYRKAIYAMKMIHALETLIRKQPICLIIDITEKINPGNTLSLLARKFNLPFVLSPQTLVTDMSLVPSRASYYFVWGKHYKHWLEKRGIPSKNIKTTGNLSFYYMKNSHFVRRNKFVEKSPPIITYLTQTYENTVALNVMNWLTYTAKRHPNVHFLIKKHPANRFDYSPYTTLQNIHLIHDVQKLYPILYLSDAVMTISSTSAFQAALMNKPIIVLQPSIPYHYITNNNDCAAHLVHASAGPVAHNESELSQHVSSFFNNSACKKSIQKQSNHFLRNSLQTRQDPAKLTYNLIKKIAFR